jgi:hypothetical protein
VADLIIFSGIATTDGSKRKEKHLQSLLQSGVLLLCQWSDGILRDLLCAPTQVEDGF